MPRDRTTGLARTVACAPPASTPARMPACGNICPRASLGRRARGTRPGAPTGCGMRRSRDARTRAAASGHVGTFRRPRRAPTHGAAPGYVVRLQPEVRL